MKIVEPEASPVEDKAAKDGTTKTSTSDTDMSSLHEARARVSVKKSRQKLYLKAQTLALASGWLLPERPSA